jgi:hypothetical protein
VNLPRIVFSDLMLGELAFDPLNGKADDLPYPYITHLRDVLSDFTANTKDSKLVLKHVREGVLYRTVQTGFYVGDHDQFVYYPFPSRAELESTYYDWWRSAQIAHFD